MRKIAAIGRDRFSIIADVVCDLTIFLAPITYR
jgi:hypothetical protein